MAFAPHDLKKQLIRPFKAKSGQRRGQLHRSDLPMDTAELAQFLIGKTLVHELPQGRMIGRIVETEAYIVGDEAGHAFRGMTRRNRSLFLERGHAYVHVAYGLHFMLNVTGESPGIGAGVLLRALEPLEGIALMQQLRNNLPLASLANGPGRLAAALGIDLEYDGMDLCAEGPLWLAEPVRQPGVTGKSVRIGITRDAHRLLRFYERGNPYVSGPKRLTI